MKRKKANKMDKLWKAFMPIFLVLLGVDQIAKALAVKYLDTHDVGGVGLSLTYNDGIVFGIDMPTVYIYALTIFVLIFGVYVVAKNKLWQDRMHMAGFSLLLAGAVGNLVDRIRVGAVIDFVKVYWWPTFNLADVFIVAAVILFAWEIIVNEEAFADL